MRTIRWLMTTNLPAMGAMLLGGSSYGLIVGGGLVFGVTRAKNYSGRIFSHTIFRPLSKKIHTHNFSHLLPKGRHN